MSERGKGWICLDRSILENPLWADKPFTVGQAWIDLLLLANHKDTVQTYNGQIITFKRGTVYRSISFLADRWGWDRRKVRRYLSLLEREEMGISNSTTHGTTITLINYDKYQGYGTTDCTTDCTTDVQPMYINNNDNNDNNVKEKENKKKSGGKPHRSFIPPTIEEVETYCKERNNGVDARAFVDYYTSVNWMIGKSKMKDWKAAVRTWERRDKERKINNGDRYNSVSNVTSEQRKEYLDFDDIINMSQM